MAASFCMRVVINKREAEYIIADCGIGIHDSHFTFHGSGTIWGQMVGGGYKADCTTTRNEIIILNASITSMQRILCRERGQGIDFRQTGRCLQIALTKGFTDIIQLVCIFHGKIG